MVQQIEKRGLVWLRLVHCGIDVGHWGLDGLLALCFLYPANKEQGSSVLLGHSIRDSGTEVGNVACQRTDGLECALQQIPKTWSARNTVNARNKAWKHTL